LGIDAQHTARRHRELGAQYRIQQHAKAAAEAETRRRAIGNLLITLVVIAAIGLGTYTLHREAEMLRQEIH
jgi:hypothetical protein